MKQFLTLKTLRILLYIGIFLIASLLFFDWEMLTAQSSQKAAEAAAQPSQNNTGAPNLALGTNGSSATPAAANLTMSMTKVASTSANLITVNTPLYTLKINPKGGDIVAAVLKQYKTSTTDATPLTLLSNDPNSLYYVVNSGLVTNASDIPNEIPFTSNARNYTLNGAGPGTVSLSWRSPRGVVITKNYTFYPNQYAVNVSYSVKNQSNAALTMRFYGELSRMPPNAPRAFWNSYTNYVGAAISYPDDHYQKLSFSDMAKDNLNQTVASGWVAMLQHYFITAWVPNPGTITQFSSLNNNVYSIGLANATQTMQPGQAATTGATLYLGPAIANQLSHVAPYLDKAVDYGWLWFISELIFEVMQWVHHYVGNWGVAIIIVTILIKLMFYPLSAKSYRSMARMRELQPKIAELRNKFGDDRQKLGLATMELYRKEKVNPLGGCLPILVQIPVFIALYWVIMESVEFRQAPFFGWIHDLSARDPYFILPVLMGLSMLVQQRISPKPPDPMQAKMMMILPVVFTVMFLGFPSGLVLYWLVNNCLSVLQQWWVTRQTLRQDGFRNLSKHPSKWQGR